MSQFSSSGRRGNYAYAGKTAADDALRSFLAARNNSPDYGKLAQDAAVIRSNEKVAATKAATAVTKAGVQAAGEVAAHDIKLDAKLSANKSKRKAGSVALAGQMFGKLGTAGGEKPLEPFKSGRDYGAEAQELRETAAETRSGKQDVPTLTSTSTSTSTTGSTPAGKGGSTGVTSTSNAGGSVGLQVMQQGIDMGMTPQAAAAMAGNAQYESANFTAHEEYAPNSYGTKGAGYFQWTNSRRTDFENWSASQGLDPTSHEANIGFMGHELQGSQHWSGGRSTQSFGAMTSIEDATREFQNHYLRPADLQGSLGQRTQNANNLYNQWSSQQSQRAKAAPSEARPATIAWILS